MEGTETELHRLHARIVGLEERLEELRRRHDALAAMCDRMLEFLRVTHGPDAPVLREIETLAERAIAPE